MRYYQEDVASFAGLKANTPDYFDELYRLAAPGQVFVLFSPEPYPVPHGWNLLTHIEMYQMVYTESSLPPEGKTAFEDLHSGHVDEMLALVALTEPGPFRQRTIELSNYTGIFDQDRLVSMAGHRFHPAPYIEISAVCTHPSHVGKGYAYTILREQIRRILSKDQIPFLHVRQDNAGAIHVYKKIGFTIRSAMWAYVLKKEA